MGMRSCLASSAIWMTGRPAPGQFPCQSSPAVHIRHVSSVACLKAYWATGQTQSISAVGAPADAMSLHRSNSKCGRRLFLPLKMSSLRLLPIAELRILSGGVKWGHAPRGNGMVSDSRQVALGGLVGAASSCSLTSVS